ncbi:cell death regulator Aven [Huso huso]|uniref:Cell death regulator Aven n=1 Tax=Huso huso TaxID=61971 RepID=A0ABR0Z432_HUSHU
MEPRARNRGSGRGGGRGGRGGWRRNAGDKQNRDGGDGSETGAPEHRGRGRGGAHRGRGRQEHRGRGHTPARGRISEKQVEEEVDVKHSDDEDFGPSVFSRRKLVSNWDRYEAAEKEEVGESGQSQRGADFSVLLSSAGDSFTQFRFAEEKEWEIDTPANNQMSALYVDCQSLAQSLQELPLHLRLNLEAELVQVTTPLELPPVMINSKKEDVTVAQFRGPSAGKSESFLSSAAASPFTSSVTLADPLCSAAPQPAADELDEELDVLLTLEDPVQTAKNSLLPDTTAQDMETVDIIAAADPVSEHGKEASAGDMTMKKEITEDELEDWLDSMIS